MKLQRVVYLLMNTASLWPLEVTEGVGVNFTEMNRIEDPYHVYYGSNFDQNMLSSEGWLSK